jgi:hypothetical protein
VVWFTPIDICPDHLNSFFDASSNVRFPTVQRFTGNFVPPVRSFAFSNVNSRDVFIAIHRIGSNGYWSGCFAASWKIFKVVHVAKVPDPLEPGHCKPIIILPALSKAFLIVMRDQMVAYSQVFVRAIVASRHY